MRECIYRLKKLPDLTLAKYQSLGENGIEGVLERQAAFLRQWQGLSLMCDIKVHLIIMYSPKHELGNRISIFLGYSYSDERYGMKIKNIMYASPVSEYFEFVPIYDEEISNIKSITFKNQSIIKKVERKKITDDDNSLSLFTVEGFETNSKARLYDMQRIMEALNEEAAYCVTLVGVDAFDKATRALEKPISILRKKTNDMNDSIVLQKEKRNRIVRDVVVEDTLKNYEDFLNLTTKSPCFHVNIRVLANDELVSKILINAAYGESIKQGNCEIKDCAEGTYFLIDNDLKMYVNIVPDSLKFWPTTFSLEEILPFFRLPALYDGEYIEMQKETSPNFYAEGIYLGETVQKKKTYLTQKTLMKHAFVCGVPGAGKTNTMLHIANSLWHNKEIKFGVEVKRNIPFLVLEPAKKEYRELALFDIPELIIFSPNANTKFPLRLNPFEFPKGLTVSEHINMLKQVFEGAFPMQPPAPFILDQSIEKIYLNKGWRTNDINMGDKEYPKISDLYTEFRNQLENTNYDSEIRGNIQSVLEMRIGSLMRREKKDIFDVEKSILEPEEWLKKPIVIELESLGKEASNFITLLICTLIRETLKSNPMEGIESKILNNGSVEMWKPLRHIIFIEEAHNLIATQNEMEANQDSNPKIAATECIVDMLKEVRALREGIIIADQLPTAMATDVIKNSNIKIVHRLTSGDDRGLVGSTMSANDLQMEQVSTYLPGQALMTYEGLMRPFELRVHNLEEHGSETPNDERLYDIMKEKPGQIEIYKRLEFRAWTELQHKIVIALQLENANRKALRQYDFESKNPNQIEAYFEQCISKYQALELMKQAYTMEYNRLSQSYIKINDVKKTYNILKTIGVEFKRDVTILIEKYM